MAFLRSWGAVLTLALFVYEAEQSPIEAAGPQPRPHLGINLFWPADYNTEMPFVDVFRMSRPWTSKGQGTGQGPALDLDSHGWVTRLRPGCSAETVLCNIRGGHYPGGIYTVLYDGEGKLSVGGTATLVSEKPGVLQIRVNPERAFFLRLLSTNPGNYVRNIRVIMPGFVKKYQDNPWNPQFLQRWQGAACLRFKDFMLTDNSTISSWSQRPTLATATFSRHGVPVELMCDLANRLNADAWFCMPHLADDDYVRNFAKLVKQNLRPGLKAYIEYSNELWNGGYKQQKYASEQGMSLGLASEPHMAARLFTSLRSVEIFKIWESAFGGTSRLVRVLSSQAPNVGLSRRIVSFQDAYRHADALAIAPYIAFIVRPKAPQGQPSGSEVPTWTLDQLFAYLKSQSLPKAVLAMKNQKAVADQYGLKLVAYEGGQHLVGAGPMVNNDALTNLLFAANADPRMGDIYRTYFQSWEKAGGDVFCYFCSVAKWNKYGSWGILQHQDDDPSKSPKYMATIEWAKSRGQNIKMLSPSR